MSEWKMRGESQSIGSADAKKKVDNTIVEKVSKIG